MFIWLKVNIRNLLLLIVLSVLVFPLLSMADIDSVVDANNKFTFELYSNLSKEKREDNIFFSPFSISTALAMTYEGARGMTAKEMARVFHFSEDNKTRREGFLGLINEINKKDKKYQLHTANALWVEKTYKLLDDYLSVVDKYYHGKATNVGFLDSSERESSRQMINQWVERETNDKIKELLKPPHLTKDTKLVLTNAIYFKGKWKTQFDKKLTKEDDFKVNEKKTKRVPMMRLQSNIPFMDYPEFKYAETDDLQALELPYEGNELSMLILLPKKSLEGIENKLNYQMIKDLREKLNSRPVEVYLPRFKSKTAYQLETSLIKMGMPTAFSDNADFSGMDGTTLLKIDSVIHKAFVEVNEEGTEAAAATAVVMVAKLSAIKEKPVVFRADHPFIFLIQHNKTGAILFIGRLYAPEV